MNKLVWLLVSIVAALLLTHSIWASERMFDAVVIFISRFAFALGTGFFIYILYAVVRKVTGKKWPALKIWIWTTAAVIAVHLSYTFFNPGLKGGWL